MMNIKRTIIKQEDSPLAWTIQVRNDDETWMWANANAFNHEIDSDREIHDHFKHRELRAPYWDCSLAFDTIESGLKMLKIARAKEPEHAFRLIEITRGYTHAQVEEEPQHHADDEKP